MMMLSLVVPIYGVEKYINRFLVSLEKNLQSNIEVLLVDDGTKDASGIIADEFAQKYPQYVKVIHKENGGLSSARNTGLKLAKGDYIIFPDPDDYLTDDYVSTILKAIEQYNFPDVIFFDYYTGAPESGYKRNTVSKFKEGFVSKEAFLREFGKDDQLKSMVWCKAIKKCFYDGLEFNTKTRVSEDYELLTDLVIKIKTTVYIRKALYYYIVRNNSLTQTAKFSDSLKMFELVMDRYNKHSKLLRDLSIYPLAKFAHLILVEIYTHNFSIDTQIFEQIIKNNVREIVFSKDFSLNKKKQCLLIYFGLAKPYYKMKYRNK